jgi:hypothetical protein
MQIGEPLDLYRRTGKIYLVRWEDRHNPYLDGVAEAVQLKEGEELKGINFELKETLKEWMKITTTSLPTPYVDKEYKATLEVEGGKPPYT